MKITEVRKSTCHYVETEEGGESPAYRRNSSTDWERAYGCSWEMEYGDKERKLEALFQEYQLEQHKRTIRMVGP